MATAMGPERWKDTSIGGIKVAQTLIDRAERDVYDAKRTDPLPSLRDSCVQESNRRIHSYARATRAVVVHLRQVLVATNEEIKSLNRTREALERSLDHCRKDIALNVQCIKTRNERPKREKVLYPLEATIYVSITSTVIPNANNSNTILRTFVLVPC